MYLKTPLTRGSPVRTRCGMKPTDLHSRVHSRRQRAGTLRSRNGAVVWAGALGELSPHGPAFLHQRGSFVTASRIHLRTRLCARHSFALGASRNLGPVAYLRETQIAFSSPTNNWRCARVGISSNHRGPFRERMRGTLCCGAPYLRHSVWSAVSQPCNCACGIACTRAAHVIVV